MVYGTQRAYMPMAIELSLNTTEFGNFYMSLLFCPSCTILLLFITITLMILYRDIFLRFFHKRKSMWKLDIVTFSGNDGNETIKKFKVLVMRTMNKGLLPKGQAKEILVDLATMGY